MPDVAACVVSFLVVAAAAALLPQQAAAQTTNLELYQDMALDCLGDAATGIDTVALQASERMPYVRSALVKKWQDEGLVVFQADSAAQYPLLAYEIEQAEVAYARRGRQIARRVALGLRYSLTTSSGRIMLDDRCAEERSDLIDRDALEVVESDAYPETRAEAPHGGWFRRYLEPVVITAATAVAVYLFFSLRSTQADDS